MGFVSVLGFAHQLAAARIRPGDAAIDATAGNGVDTLFLAAAVGPRGKVFSVDIQQKALDSTDERLKREPQLELGEVTLVFGDHGKLPELVPDGLQGEVAAVMFNLGYLPGFDPSIITRPSSTIPALDGALQMLRPGGILTIVLYSGHEGGQEEADAVAAWAEALPQRNYQCLSYRFLNRGGKPPYLIAVEKLEG